MAATSTPSTLNAEEAENVESTSSQLLLVTSINDLCIDGKQSDKQLARLEKRDAKRKRRLERSRSRSMIETYWDALPIDLLERIFSLLSIKDRHVASQVCPHWYECFYMPYNWHIFILDDLTLTKRKYNYHLGYIRNIDPYKTQLCLHKFGHCIRKLIIKPMTNYFNLYEFMNIMENYSEHYENNPLLYLHTFDFTFGCNPTDNHNFLAHYSEVLGTGGKILQCLRRLLNQLVGLRHLRLRNLLLDTLEAKYFLDDVAANYCEQLRSLSLVNCTKTPYAFLHVSVFVNLETLVISGQHLSEENLTLLTYTQLQHLYIVENTFTEEFDPLPLSVWRRFAKINPGIEIHLAKVNTVSRFDDMSLFGINKLLYQCSSVTSIIFDTPTILLDSIRLDDIATLYADSLQCLAFYQQPKRHIPKSYCERADASLIWLSQKCTRLHTLIFRELISTATLLLIATNARSLTRLYVRQNGIRKRFDCPIDPNWNDHYIQWLRNTSRSFEATYTEISRLLGYRWRPLTDEQFKQLRPDVIL